MSPLRSRARWSRSRVQRGGQVKAGDPLFWLDSGSEKSVRDEAERKAGASAGHMEGCKKANVRSEIERAIQAQLKQDEPAPEPRRTRIHEAGRIDRCSRSRGRTRL